MSIDQNTNVEPEQDIDLDDFAAELFSNETKSVEEPTEEVAEEDSPEEETEEDTLATEETVEEEASENSPDEEEAEETEDPSPKKKKNSFQERITELNAKYREEERKRLELEAKVNELIAAKQEAPKQEVENTKVEPVEGEPTPTDKNEDGTDRYPLGEFDPRYMKDFVAHQLKVQEQERTIQREKEERENSLRAERDQLLTNWNEKLVDAQERYPDFQQKGQNLIAAFDGLDPAYGEYLTDTIMSLDNGTEVFYHLANNPEEARQIVNSGARKASIALGKLDGRFTSDDDPNPAVTPKPKVSNAPPPPPRNKGSSPAKIGVKPDTDNLDDFERLLFKR